ncbi:hypothetical protein F5Y19DRAFT_470306 [Xylariaceae sp. FL1651]|nr:hypothetical protein F5Y19DRAFT_470306 [Xylariaceae sp. FL1651]
MAVTTFITKACLALGIASLASIVAADNASITAQNNLPDYLTKMEMEMTIETPFQTGPYPPKYAVAPLTLQAGLNESNIDNLSDISGNLIIIDHSNFNNTNYRDTVVYLSCDLDTGMSNTIGIEPNYVLNQIMSNANPPTAILLFSSTKTFCFLGGVSLNYNLIWTMTSSKDATEVQTTITQTSESVVASIAPNSTATNATAKSPNSGTSAVAMSILYSITGLITVLFLLIIATGALRAHRHPERYGPRASGNGRPSQSRARGLARAMLETLPIVKFGEADARKPDEENALRDVSGNQQQQPETSQTLAGGALNSVELEGSSDAANGSTSPHEAEDAAISANVKPEGAKKEPNVEEEHLGCSICTEDFTVGEDVRVLPCNHKFHPACVDPWLVNVSGTCPLCRLDLRPPETIEPEEDDEASATPDPTAAAAANTHLALPAETDSPAVSDATHRRRRSRLLDWNRLRHASVDERIQALRLYRQSQQGSEPTSSVIEDERRHSRLTDRLRERFHVRSEPRSNTQSPDSSNPPAPSATTVQH